jgi:hypothetical protein
MQPAPTEPSTPCPACPDGRLGAWSHVRAGGQIALIGERALAARECDRCHQLQVAGTTPPTKSTSRVPAASTRTDLLSGLARNLAAACAELWAARPWRRGA